MARDTATDSCEAGGSTGQPASTPANAFACSYPTSRLHLIEGGCRHSSFHGSCQPGNLVPSSSATRCVSVRWCWLQCLQVMSKLAAEHQSVNLGQGFPDDEGPEAMKQVGL